MLTEARAQYEVRPSDYLDGVLTGLSDALTAAPSEDWRRPGEQDRVAAGRDAVGRARDYYRGRVAALEWAMGRSKRPPLVVVMTPPPAEPTES